MLNISFSHDFALNESRLDKEGGVITQHNFIIIIIVFLRQGDRTKIADMGKRVCWLEGLNVCFGIFLVKCPAVVQNICASTSSDDSYF